VSPIQKAKIVEAVKTRVSGVTLAIGDGANDVSMIQMAHVGIGISGVEGLQAARVSDCSVAFFSCLQRLLLVHGRWNYRRIARLIIFTFYKNITLYMTQFWFATYNQFSGQTLYDSWSLSMYNLAFTALPIMTLAVFDKDVEGKRLLHLTQFPELYSDGMKGRLFNTREFWKYCINAVFHSLVCFFLTIYACVDLVDVDSGTQLGMAGHAIVAYSILLNVVTLKCALEVNTWTLLNAALFFISIFFWYLFLIVYCILFKAITVNDFASWYGADTITLKHPCYWLCQLVIVVVALMRDAGYKYWRKTYEPRLSHVVQEFENRVGDFGRNQVKRETPWLFPKREIKAFKPSLTSSSGTDRFVEMEPINLESLTSQSSFFAPENTSPGRRKTKISDIIDSCDI
jgi:phospholipid-transporting ATPase